jgi:polysaccharide chain length determinant protein (PEP-CTERM system associated)
MLPGKKYTAEDILRLAARRAWLAGIFMVIGTVVGFVVLKRLPAWYRSETLIMLMPQRVPDALVKNTNNERIEDRLAAFEDQILSRSHLERIILDLDLYPDLRRRQPLETVVERMRKEITYKPEGKESFRLSYIGQSAVIVQNATERLASLFIEENSRDRENQAQDTDEFLAAQLEDAHARLIEHEKKLEEYRRRYSGQLPTQATTNLQAIQNLQLQLQGLEQAVDRARERRLLVERQLADLQLPDPAPVVTQQSPTGQDTILLDTATELETQRARLRALRGRGVKPDYPDVVVLQRAIRDLEAKQQAESKNAEGSKPADRIASPADGVRQKRSRDLRAELEVLDHELQEKQQQEKRLREQVADYQSRLDAMPARESDLTELMRDYTTLQTSYNTLLARREDAKLSADLQRRNIGQQFKVLDRARVPERPYSPRRLFVVGGGAGGGLVLGLLLLALLEYRDSSFTREEEVLRLCQVPVLAVIPLLSSVEERDRARTRRRTTIAAMVAGLVASAVALAIWQLRP